MKINKKLQSITKNKIDFPMTRERYLSTWKIFRTLSDENSITAKHLLTLHSWCNINSVLDLGCGDGLIMKNIVLLDSNKISKVILVDPDYEMLTEAKKQVAKTGLVQDVESYLSGFENCIDFCIEKADIILAVHLVYLITPESFNRLIDLLPVGKKLIVVLDDENSVFTKLWKKTAPRYVQRSAYVRDYLNKLSQEHFINKTIISSQIANPLLLNKEIKESLLSLMSYSDFSLMNTEKQKFVENCIKDNLTLGFVECKSVCFEVMKLK